jgi:hypothetical protein
VEPWRFGDRATDVDDMKVLTSHYDIYQDTMNPSNFPFLAGIRPDWTVAWWPADIIRQANGDWRHGWAVIPALELVFK